MAKFHALLAAENYDAIWAGTSTDMRSVTPKEKLERLLVAVHTKLGKTKTSKQVGWQENATTSGRYSEVVMDTQYERGAAREDFVFRHEGDRLLLSGYNINSTDMMVN